jgi:hypothetical protein
MIDNKKADKLRKLAIAEELINGGHEDRLLGAIGAGPERKTSDLRDQHSQGRPNRDRNQRQESWLDIPEVAHVQQGEADHTERRLHYHCAESVCALRHCPLDQALTEHEAE